MNVSPKTKKTEKSPRIFLEKKEIEKPELIRFDTNPYNAGVVRVSYFETLQPDSNYEIKWLETEHCDIETEKQRIIKENPQAKIEEGHGRFW